MSAPIVFAVAGADARLDGPAFADAMVLMEELNTGERLWVYSSRNLWLNCTAALGEAMHLDGLGFMRQQAVMLDGEGLSGACACLGQMIAALTAGTAPLDALDPARAECLGQHPPKDGDFEPTVQGDDGGDASPERSAGIFYRYLGSLQFVAGQAARSRRPLFWACPQTA